MMLNMSLFKISCAVMLFLAIASLFIGAFFLGYASKPSVIVENVHRIPTRIKREGPYNIAGTPSYVWHIIVYYDFYSKEEAEKFYRSFYTWEDL